MIGTGLKERGRYNTEDCRRVDHITIEQVIVVHVLRGKGTEDDFFSNMILVMKASLL